MKKSKLFITLSLFAFFIFSNCSVEDDLKNTFEEVECTSMLGQLTLTASDERSCAQIIADIEKIENDCGEFLADDIRASFATARENCASN